MTDSESKLNIYHLIMCYDHTKKSFVLYQVGDDGKLYDIDSIQELTREQSADIFLERARSLIYG